MNRTKNVECAIDTFNMPATALIAGIALNKGIVYYDLFEKSVD